MKPTQRCPKCNGRRLWVIDPLRVPTESATGAVLPLVPHQGKVGGFLQLTALNPVGKLELFVCARCGYSELWAGEIARLAPDPENGVRLLDASTEPEGPFR